MEQTEQKNKNTKLLLLILLSFVVPFSAFVYTVVRYRNTTPAPEQKVDRETFARKPEAPPKEAITPVPQISPLPLVSSTQDIIESATIEKNCSIQIKASNRTFTFSTEQIETGLNSCPQKTLGKISPSKRYLIYNDIAGGVDSTLRVFDLAHGELFILGVWGTSTIMDYIFLPDNQVAVINGYPDIFDEQWLTIINLPKVFSDYQTNFDPQTLYLRPSNPTYQSTVNLPNSNATHFSLKYTDGKIQTLSKEGRVLVQYSPEDIILQSSNFSITPKAALTLVYYFDNPNVDPGESPSITRKFNAENSTNDYWAIDVVSSKTGKAIRQYQVDSKTGQITVR